VTADVIAGRLETTNSGAGIDDPAEYVPAASSTTSPLDALWNAPLNVAHGVVGDEQLFASLPLGDMNRFARTFGLTDHVYVAGVGSTCPRMSTASTENVWEPAPSPAYVHGGLQSTKPLWSRSHLKVDPPSLEANANETFAADVAAGVEVSVVSGGVPSTRQA
jgi:hypothetical protein